MTQINRLPSPTGMLLNRDQAISFIFEGRRYHGFAGDTIASALAANDVWLLSRSFKYHRPRGVLTMAGQDANALVQLDGEPNVLADRHLIEPDLEVRGQNYFGTLDRDWGAILGLLGRFLPPGFYYKAFYKPRGAFKFWEPIIRRMAGLGTVDTHAPHAYHDKAYGFCDLAVIGGGPAGMAAALEAAGAGADVILIDDNPIVGGFLNFGWPDAERDAGMQMRDELVEATEASPNITMLTGAVCQAWFADNWLPITKGNRLHKIRAKTVVIATGATEQHLVFRNNDLPGVMLGSAAQRLLHLYGVRPGNRAVIATTDGSGYGVALDLAGNGTHVAAIIDAREKPPDCQRASAARARDIPIYTGHKIGEAISAHGTHHVTGIEFAPLARQDTATGHAQRIDCDLVCMSGGTVPAAGLARHAGARLVFDEKTGAFHIRNLPSHVFTAGAVDGASSIEGAEADGRQAGRAAAADAGFTVGPQPRQEPEEQEKRQYYPLAVPPHPKGKDFVDYDEDLQVGDIINTIADGFSDPELLKRYSTVGMGPSQGRQSALPTGLLAAEAVQRPLADFGLTTARPPIGPVSFAHLAGRTFEPVRRTAMHDRHLELGAAMMVAGQWMRPAYYGSEQEKEILIADEVNLVRRNVGIIDVSTLGGLEIRGSDAAQFMNRVYTFSYATQLVGRGRYVLMTDETGAIIDDGIACRFHEHHFYVTATTGGVDGVHRHMLWLNAQWRLDVDITNVTAAYCGINIAGPNSRAVLGKLCGDVDLSAEAFPYMGVKQGTVAGIPARILRVGFVGELGFEIHAPADCGEALWDAIIEAGLEHGLRPFGVEAQRVLRLEKGHIIVGQDTDGLVHPLEAGMGWAVSKKKPDFIGKRSIEIRNANGAASILVGFTLADHAAPPPAEGHIVVSGPDITGHVTSAAYSPTLDKVIGLAYVPQRQSKSGERFQIKIEGRRIVEAEVIPIPFYDPENKRQEL